MTPTPEGRQLAADLANAERRTRQKPEAWAVEDFEDGDLQLALARLATEHLALKAEHEKALADLREIDRIAVDDGWPLQGGQDPCARVFDIAAKYRVETDPLLIELAEALELAHVHFSSEENATALLAELAKRGYGIGEKS